VLERCQHLSGDDRVQALWQASARSYAWAWQSHYCQEHDPSQILGELNLFRYRPVRGLLVRAEAATALVPLIQVVLAALTCEAPLTVSLSPDRDDWDWLADLSTVQVMVEDEASLIACLNAPMRSMTGCAHSGRCQLHYAGLSTRRASVWVDVPVLANGRLELRYYLREQAVSRRYTDMATS